MTKYELATILQQMYNNASNEKVTMIHLFGIKYAQEIKEIKVSPKEIVTLAKLPESYKTEVSKGIKLAKYVKVIN